MRQQKAEQQIRTLWQATAAATLMTAAPKLSNALAEQVISDWLDGFVGVTSAGALTFVHNACCYASCVYVCACTAAGACVASNRWRLFATKTRDDVKRHSNILLKSASILVYVRVRVCACACNLIFALPRRDSSNQLVNRIRKAVCCQFAALRLVRMSAAELLLVCRIHSGKSSVDWMLINVATTTNCG